MMPIKSREIKNHFHFQQNEESGNQSLNWTLDSTAELNDSDVRFVGTTSQPNTVETFCNTPHPTSSQFDELEETDKLAAFRDYLKVCLRADLFVSGSDLSCCK